MANPDDNLYEYAIVRYLPDIERGEFLNVGLVMMCKRRRWLRAEIFIDERKAHVLFPDADLHLLRNQLGIYLRDDVPSRDIPVEERYRWLTARKSAIIQTSDSHPGIAPTVDSPEICMGAEESFQQLDKEFDRLMQVLVR